MSHRCLDAQRFARPRCIFGRLFGFDPLHPDAVAWYRRALSERRVGRILAGLGRGWRVLHAVPQGDEDDHIDHLVIGPPGVFTISTTGIVAAEVEARAASRALVRATGIPIVAGAIVVTSRHAAPLGPSFVAERRLVRHLRDLPTVFGPDLVASIARAAEEWTTWRPFALGAGHLDPDGDFERLLAAVTSARRRRVAWQLAGTAAVTAAVFAVAARLFF